MQIKHIYLLLNAFTDNPDRNVGLTDREKTHTVDRIIEYSIEYFNDPNGVTYWEKFDTVLLAIHRVHTV